MSKAARSLLWLFATGFALVSAGVAALLWRDGHVEHANAEVAAVLVPVTLAALLALAASGMLRAVADAVSEVVAAWKGKAP